MALTYGFYDSLNHDRLYNAQQMSAIFDGIINDGVFMSVGNQLHTVAGSGMQVIVKSGRAWFNSTWTLNDQEYPLTISAADVLLTRIDAVVLEVNSEQATRANSLKIVKGTPASTPVKPTLTNTSTVHQHALAYVTVAKNTSAITNSMIEIVVGKTETPYVTAILQTTDITDLFNQWQDQFTVWFETVKGTLDGDVALNLQNQIDHCVKKADKATSADIEAGTADKWVDASLFSTNLYQVGDALLTNRTIETGNDFCLANGVSLYPTSKLFEMKKNRNDEFVLCPLPEIPTKYETINSNIHTVHYFTKSLTDSITADRYYVEMIVSYTRLSSTDTLDENFNIIAYRYNINTDKWEIYSTLSTSFTTNDAYTTNKLTSVSSIIGLGAVNGNIFVVINYHRGNYTYDHYGIRIIKSDNNEYVLPAGPNQYNDYTMCTPVLNINNTYYVLIKKYYNSSNKTYIYYKINITDTNTITHTTSTVNENRTITPVAYDEKNGYYIGQYDYNGNRNLFAIERSSFSQWVNIGYHAYDNNYTISNRPLVVYNGTTPYVILGYSVSSMLNYIVYTTTLSSSSSSLTTKSVWAFPIDIIKENDYYLYICADRSSPSLIPYDDIHVYKFDTYPTYNDIITKPENIVEMPDTPMIKLIKSQSSSLSIDQGMNLYNNYYIYKEGLFIALSSNYLNYHSGYILPILSFDGVNAFIKIN